MSRNPNLPVQLYIAALKDLLLFAMGDCRRPLIESATLIEDIASQQMTALLLKAAEVTAMRGARFISLEDFLFLMRRDRDKLKRLLRFLSMKDLKSKLNKATAADDEDMYAEAAGDIKPSVSKRRKISYEFLNTIDQTGELVALFEEEDQLDEIKQERLERAEKQSRNLDTTSYQEYTESRQVNFHKKASKFKEWLDCSHLVETKPNPLAMEVLSYLAYETVAQVVDLSLLVQRDMEAQAHDPFIQATPPSCVSDTSLYSPSTQVNIKSKPPPALDSPNHSPPSTPTTPTSSVVSPFLSSSSNLNMSFNSNSSNGSLQQSNNSQSSVQQNPVTKAKPKKRKKSGATSTLEENAGAASGNAIQPLHIREAMRRYYQNIGPMAAFSKHSSVPFIMRFLGC
ncbi:transcription initiation protein SPT3 homolog isoform X2 [Ptychodera flava]|uniref:transcription initiation protein SPT3 homolog isoform X2 n=1 Tax=Ptychodera flava TaxID=63121 RepID=UPI003969D585